MAGRVRNGSKEFPVEGKEAPAVRPRVPAIQILSADPVFLRAAQPFFKHAKSPREQSARQRDQITDLESFSLPAAM